MPKLMPACASDHPRSRSGPTGRGAPPLPAPWPDARGVDWRVSVAQVRGEGSGVVGDGVWRGRTKDTLDGGSG